MTARLSFTPPWVAITKFAYLDTAETSSTIDILQKL